MGKNSPDMRICVFCGSSLGKDPAFQEQAENLGRLFAELGIGLVYGGSDRGLMGKVSGACFEEGGEVLAIEPSFFLKWGATTEKITRLIPTSTMSERKQKMMELSDSFLALPGGIGTLDEISDVATCLGLGQAKGKLILFNLNHFYDPFLILLKQYEEQGFLSPDWKGRPIVCNTFAEIKEALEGLREEIHA